MGILELHFHDPEFSWSVNPGSGKERSFSLRTGSKSSSKLKSKLSSKSKSKSKRARGRSAGGDGSALDSKFGMLAVLGLVVGAGVAFNRLQSRRHRRETAATESTSPGRRLSLFRGK